MQAEARRNQGSAAHPLGEMLHAGLVDEGDAIELNVF